MMNAVANILRSAAREAILPRFRALQSGDIEEKSPGELVTAADRDAEALLTTSLQKVIPGSVVLGEEATSKHPQLYELLIGEKDVWVVDPLDGTANFVSGSTCFSVMVALVRNGTTIASWMLDPLTDQIAMAELGSGASWDGRPIKTPQAVPSAHALNGAVLTRFLPAEIRSAIDARKHLVGSITAGLRCAGHEYPAIALGTQHFVMFWRTEPWDHAPGALFITEAGGSVARLDRSPYTPIGKGQGLLVAQNQGIWDLVEHALLSDTQAPAW